jgi:hypothetical protein
MGASRRLSPVIKTKTHCYDLARQEAIDGLPQRCTYEGRV